MNLGLNAKAESELREWMESCEEANDAQLMEAAKLFGDNAMGAGATTRDFFFLSAVLYQQALRKLFPDGIDRPGLVVARSTEIHQVDIAAAAPVEFTAAAGADGLPGFEMIAYTGGAMRVGGFYRPVVVDLAGVQAGAVIPMFRGHDPEKIIGHGTVAVSKSDIRAKGVISADNDHSREVLTLSKNKFPWQASIGATIEESESLRERDKAMVNGQTITGPAIIARKAMLNEISFVPLGADRRTTAVVGN